MRPGNPRLLGLAGITEGAIPMAIEDPLRVIGSFVLGSMVTGAIVGAMNIGLSTPGAGIFSLFYFMIMARAVLWRQLAGLVRHWWGCNLDCNSPDLAASRG